MPASDEYYTRYREGMIKRHICRNGRFLEGVWLVEDSGLPPNNPAWAGVRRSTVEKKQNGQSYQYNAYPLLIKDARYVTEPNFYIAGGGDNPLLFGGLAMATFAIEHILGISEHSLDYAKKLLQFFIYAEGRTRKNKPTGYYIRKRHEWRKAEPFSQDEIGGMLVGLTFLREAAKKGNDDEGLLNIIDQIGWNLGAYLQKVDYVIDLPPGVLTLNAGDWSEARGQDAWVFQHPFNRAFKFLAGRTFPASETVPDEHVQKAADFAFIRQLADALGFWNGVNYTSKDLFKDMLANFPWLNHVDNSNFFNGALMTYGILMEIVPTTTSSSIKKEIAKTGGEFFRALCYDRGALDGTRKDAYHNALFGVVAKACHDIHSLGDTGWLNDIWRLTLPLLNVEDRWFSNLPLGTPSDSLASPFKVRNSNGEYLWGGWYSWMNLGGPDNPEYSICNSPKWNTEKTRAHIGPGRGKLSEVTQADLLSHYSCLPQRGFRIEAAGIDFLFAKALGAYFNCVQRPVLTDGDALHSTLPVDGAENEGFLANAATGEFHDISRNLPTCFRSKFKKKNRRWFLRYMQVKENYNACGHCLGEDEFKHAVDSDQADAADIKYLGNRQSKEVHRLASRKPRCNLNDTVRNNLLYYKSLSKARADGLDPCKHCMPDKSTR